MRLRKERACQFPQVIEHHMLFYYSLDTASLDLRILAMEVYARFDQSRMQLFVMKTESQAALKIGIET